MQSTKTKKSSGSTTGVRLYPWQQKVRESNAPIKVLKCGRRSGKSRGVMYDLLETLDRFSRTPIIRDGEQLTAREAGLVPPIDVWIVVPTMAQGDQVWEELKEFMPPNLVRDQRWHGGRGKGWLEDDKIVWLEFRDKDGNWLKGRWRPTAKIQIKTADNPKALQTRGLDYLWINEAQDVSQEAWNKLNPMLDSANRFGEARIEGIPAESPAHWYAKLYKATERGELEDHFCINVSFYENPDLSPRQIRRIEDRKKTMLLQDWERMYLAKDPDGGGGAIRKIDVAMGKVVEHADPQPGVTYVAGLDLGRTTDPTVLLIGDKEGRNVHFGLELMNVDWEINKYLIENELRRWNCEQIKVDATGMGGDMYATYLEWQNLPVMRHVFTNALP